MNKENRKYKVEFLQKEVFVVDVFAKDQKQAMERAEKEWNNGNYQELGDIQVEISTIYDVTDTDDPFNP